MTKTYTPILLDGKWVLVEKQYMVGQQFKNLYEPQKIPTLEQDAPYWQSKEGDSIKDIETTTITSKYLGMGFIHETYAIPPQQKQGDEKPDAVEFAEYMDKYYPISDLFNKGESFEGFYQRFKAGLPPQS